MFMIEGIGHQAYGWFGYDFFDENGAAFPGALVQVFNLKAKISFFKIARKGNWNTT